ncbi:MAG: tRNA (guanosine(46)-N7)-methyltransferase TrmB [Oscillospiraceae bacterium]
MRMRFKPYARPELLASGFHVDEPISLRGAWHESFNNAQNPLYLELGCGKGGFLAQHAAQNPQINYIGIDITDKVLIVAKRKIDTVFSEAKRNIDNVKLLSFDIERIDEMMSEKDVVSRIYINFCNPWNRKKSHKKHRLTYPKQLLKYKEFLADDGEIWFKCDDADLFEDSVEYFEEAGYTITWITRDLHKDEPSWNIRTEHEQMFADEGISIKALIAQKSR